MDTLQRGLCYVVILHLMILACMGVASFTYLEDRFYFDLTQWDNTPRLLYIVFMGLCLFYGKVTSDLDRWDKEEKSCQNT